MSSPRPLVPPTSTSTSTSTSTTTLQPRVAALINTCRAQRTAFRVITAGESETRDNPQRLTIVVDPTSGGLVKQYYG